MPLQSQSFLITGASRGLGRALAERLTAQGASVALVARHAEPLHALVHELRARGADAHAIVADVADKRAIHRISAQASAALGRVDGIIHAASTLGPTPLRSLMDTECEDFEAVLQTNLLGPFRLSKALLGSMLLRGDGVVVNVSSDAAVDAYPTWGSYGVSKAALDHLTRIWAAELADSGIRMLAVDPGEMDTRMHAEAMPDADPSTLARPDAVAARVVDMIADLERAPNGERLVAPDWKVAS